MPRNPKIYVSYAWQDANDQGESCEKIVDEIKSAVDSAGYQLIRDKEGGVGFGFSISKYMQEIGKGDLVIIVVSKKYLRSKNCMYEVIQINENNNFPQKVIFVVHGDVDIHSSAGRSQYHQYWLNERKEVEARTANNIQNSYIEELELCTKVEELLDTFMRTVSDTNTLTVEHLRESNFAEIISDIHNVFDEFNDFEIERVAKFLASKSIYKISPVRIERIYRVLEGYKSDRRYSGFANYLWLIVYLEYSKPHIPPDRLKQQQKKRFIQALSYKLSAKERELEAGLTVSTKLARQFRGLM